MSALNKYIWIVDTIHRAGERGLSLKEINERWVETEQSGHEPIPRQTFDRWKWSILDMLGVVIGCHKKGGYRYYIDNPEVLRRGELRRWLLDTYTTYNALSHNIALKDRIIVDEIPSSRDFLTDILDAMKGNKVLSITYKNFQHDRSYTFPVAPYCVKMFQKRWYLLGLSLNDDKLRLYGIDRIESMEQTGQTFDLPEDFDAKTYFSSYFGVVHDETKKVEKIVIRADETHQHYLRTLPLHESQKEIFTCDDYAEFELHLRPTYDFCMELLRAGGMIEVLEPQSLRHDMHSWVCDLWEMYKND